MAEEYDALGRLNFRGCDLTAECRLARANVRAQLPATAPIREVAHQLVRQSLQNSVCLGQHQGDLPIFNGVVADK